LAKRDSGRSADLASALNNFGLIYTRARRYEQAIHCFSESLELSIELLGPEDLLVAFAAESLASAYMHVGRVNDADKLFEQALVIVERKCGPHSLRTASTLTKYARLLRYQRRKNEARAFEIRAKLIRDETGGDWPLGESIDVRELARYGTRP
jgi:tetratricopeptide (TPR) repeat protein